MSTAPRALFAGLVDDAALFPPGNAPMRRALTEHAAHREAWYADLVGPFLCPASRVPELHASLDGAGPARLAISLIMDITGEPAHAALRAVAADDRLALVLVEAAHAVLGEDAALVGTNVAKRTDALGFLEAPRAGWEATLDLVVGGDWEGVKYRTGGTSAGAFPSEVELAGFLRTTVDREVAVKLTAGLHHAVRHTGPGTGFEHHGVLNVLVAVRAALNGAEAPEMARLLGLREPAELVDRAGRMSDADAAVLRQFFVSFGCCGVTEPIDDLVALGLVGPVAST
jgi:hypothetical protein